QASCLAFINYDEGDLFGTRIKLATALLSAAYRLSMGHGCACGCVASPNDASCACPRHCRHGSNPT
ncbi:hypothetical protein HAX54_047215, partial [Datura stramonium]|nr:hypothetical protein [Datura stramonium]